MRLIHTVWEDNHMHNDLSSAFSKDICDGVKNLSVFRVWAKTKTSVIMLKTPSGSMTSWKINGELPFDQESFHIAFFCVHDWLQWMCFSRRHKAINSLILAWSFQRASHNFLSFSWLMSFCAYSESLYSCLGSLMADLFIWWMAVQHNHDCCHILC